MVSKNRMKGLFKFLKEKRKMLLGIMAIVGIPLTVYAAVAPGSLKKIDTPSDEECLTYEATGTAFEWQNCIASATGDITLENSEFIDNGTDGTINLGRNDTGTVTLGSLDDDTTAALTINPGGVTTLTLGGSTDTVTVAATTGLTLGSSESVNTGTDATFDFTRDDVGIVTLTCSDTDATAGCTYDAGGASPIVIGSADVTNIRLIADTDYDFTNGATGNVDVSLRDYADTTDDDMAHTLFRTNCTDTGSGSEDCDFGISVPEAGAAVEERFAIDADGGITIGSSNNNLVTITTDSTGNGELVVPNESIGAVEILNLTRSIPLPLHSWVPCADGVWDSSGADTEPDLIATPASTLAIVYDDTGGSIDTGTICNSFTVPADYASGGSFEARLTQDGATASIETFSCAISVDGAAIGATNAGSNVSQTAVQTVVSTPAGTWAAGAAIQVACSQGLATADDTVNFHSIEAKYTAVQQIGGSDCLFFDSLT